MEDVAHKQILCFLNSFTWFLFYVDLDFFYCDPSLFTECQGEYRGYYIQTAFYSDLRHSVKSLKSIIHAAHTCHS